MFFILFDPAAPGFELMDLLAEGYSQHKPVLYITAWNFSV